MRWFFVLALAACQSTRVKNECEAPPPSPPSSAPLAADGSYFRDRDGRVVLLRGANVAGDAKVPPFATVPSPEALDPLREWGMNTIRLLFTWEAYEPAPCEYDDGYLAYYEDVVRWAAARDLYVLVDFHQDAFSRFSIGGCGEGFPEWAIDSGIARQTPDNDHKCEDWGVKMVFDPSHRDTWSAFHRDSNGARARYMAMLTRVATRMSQHVNVIGYDVVNEPWGTDEELARFFEDAGAAIRARDPERILFVPPHALLSSGVGENTVKRVSHGNIAFSPHYYDGRIILFKAWWGDSPAEPLDRMLKTSAAWNAPMFLGEFGGSAGAADVARYVRSIYAWLDLRFVSGAQWNYTPAWTDEKKDGWNREDFSVWDGGLRTQLFEPRPYPQKTAGTPVSFETAGTRGFSYRWLNEAGVTEIFAPGMEVLASENASCERQDRLLVCRGEAGPAWVFATGQI